MKNASCSIIKYLCIKDKVLILFIGGMYIKNMNILFDLGRKGKSADEEYENHFSSLGVLQPPHLGKTVGTQATSVLQRGEQPTALRSQASPPL